MENKNSYSKYFLIMCMLSITFLLISNIISSKIINVFGISLTAGDIMFPVTYIFGDIFTEVYGFRKAKTVIWLGFLSNLIMVICFTIAIKMPSFYTYENQEAFSLILGNTSRLLVASFIAYLVGNFLNSIILSKIKVKTKGKYLALRTILSTIVGEGADTILFTGIAFIGIIPIEELLILMFNMYVFKVMLEIVLTPITYRVVRRVKKIENIDTYDNNIKYKIFNEN